MAMVENSGMVLGMGGDMAHHSNLNVDWYHTPSPSSQFSASVAANQAPPSQIHSSNSNGLPFHPIPDNIAHHPKKSAQNEPPEKPEAESVKKAVVPVSVPVPVELDSAGRKNGGDGGESMRELEDQFSKLNPLAQEFVPPPKQAAVAMPPPAASSSPDLTALAKKKGNSNQGKRRINSRILKAQREESVQRTVYVSDIDQQVTEEQLAGLFIGCGQVVDCRICGDPNSVLRFAFVEFTDEEGARTALSLAGTMLGFYPLRVLPSKTAIVPVNPTFLPRSEIEREMCARTVYCTNIDKKVSQADVKLFFETLCGEVSRLRMLGDFHHSTRIAFVEFVLANSAMLALNCSGVVLGSLPIRVSPSKTPVRACGPRPQSR